MFWNQEKFSAATKALVESQISTFHALGSKTIEGVEKAIALNNAVTKASVQQSIAVAKQLSSTKDPQAFFALAAALAKPNGEKATSYGRHLTEIVSSLQADFTNAAEARIAETKSKVTALVDDATKSAPAGSENAVAMLKSIIGNANAGYEQLTKATKQAVEQMEAHVAKATDQLSQAVEKTASTVGLK